MDMLNLWWIKWLWGRVFSELACRLCSMIFLEGLVKRPTLGHCGVVLYLLTNEVSRRVKSTLLIVTCEMRQQQSQGTHAGVPGSHLSAEIQHKVSERNCMNSNIISTVTLQIPPTHIEAPVTCETFVNNLPEHSVFYSK
jgi:hypothetical protein